MKTNKIWFAFLSLLANMWFIGYFLKGQTNKYIMPVIGFAFLLAATYTRRKE